MSASSDEMPKVSPSVGAASWWQIAWRARSPTRVGRPDLTIRSISVLSADAARNEALRVVGQAHQGEVRIFHHAARVTDVIASRREIAVWDTAASPVPAEVEGLWAAEDARRATALSCYIRITAVLGEAVAAGLLARGLGRELRRLVRERLAED